MQEESSKREDHLDVLSLYIKKYIAIYGWQIAVSKSKKIQSLTVTNDGELTAITGSFETVLKQLFGEYAMLSAELAKNVLKPLLGKLPNDTRQKLAYLVKTDEKKGAN